MPHSSTDSTKLMGAELRIATDGSQVAPISVRPAGPQWRSQWDAFLAGRPGAAFYHLYDWAGVNDRAFGHKSHHLVATRGDAVVGVLPLTLVSSPFFGRILCSMPFVNYGGPCADDEDAADSLVSAARSLARQENVKYLELRCAAPVKTDMHVSTRKISMSIALDPDPEAMFAKFTSKHRTNIRRSFKNGLSIETGGSELLNDFYSVMEQSWHSLGTPFYGRSYFATLMETFPEHVRIFVCRHEAKVVGVAFNGYYNGTVEGMWAGGTAEARGLQVNYALYWEMMKDACERGFSRYHLGRSTADSGAEDFKKKWNATAEQLYWYFERPDGGPMPELNVANPKYRLAIAAWQKLPLAVTRLIGPPIARAIP